MVGLVSVLPPNWEGSSSLGELVDGVYIQYMIRCPRWLGVGGE